jgi:hypothetical protein
VKLENTYWYDRKANYCFSVEDYYRDNDIGFIIVGGSDEEEIMTGFSSYLRRCCMEIGEKEFDLRCIK